MIISNLKACIAIFLLEENVLYTNGTVLNCFAKL